MKSLGNKNAGLCHLWKIQSQKKSKVQEGNAQAPFNFTTKLKCNKVYTEERSNKFCSNAGTGSSM